MLGGALMILILYIMWIALDLGRVFLRRTKKYGLSYVPLQPLSAAVDWQLFGLNPSGFYWHHLLSVSAVILLAYAVLSLFFAPLLASMIVSLFVVCVPTAQVVHYLMVRHYIEGLALALIAVWFYIKAVKQEQWTWAILGSVFYLLSTLAKELYIPLVMVLAFLPVSTVKRRIRFLLAYVFAAIIYTLLRLKMQGEYVLSSYEQTTTWQDILSFPTTFFNIMGFHAVWQWLPVVGIGIILGIALLKKPLSLGLSSFMWFSMVFAPLIPILWRIPHLYYYLFVFALLFFIGCGIALNELGKMLALSVWRTFIITSLFLCLLLANFLPGQQEQLRLQKHNQLEKIQGEFLMLSHSPSTVLIYDYHVAGSLIYLRDKVLGHTEGVKWCPRTECFCAIRYPNFMAKQYLNGQWQTHQLSTADCDDKKNQQNLSVKLTLKSPSMITWELGPYSQEQGDYEVSISLDEYGQLLSSPMIFKVPPQGRYNFLGQSLQDPLTVRIKYRSAQGWEIFSPPLILEAKPLNDKGRVEIVWQRFEKRKMD
ncbi:membrane protein [Beggiatoa sp. PS]|nr:membrane protein [Beggiatoa sp. PS]